MISILFSDVLIASLVVISKPTINEALYIDTEETKYSEIATPVDPNLGTSTLVSKSDITYETVGNNKNVYSSHTQRILYKYPKAVSAPIVAYNSYMQLTQGSTVSLSYETSYSEEKTYSEQVTDTINGSLSASVKLESGIGVFKEEKSLAATLGYEHIETESITDTYSSTVTKGMNINFYIDESGLYRLEERGMFNVYIVEYVRAFYDVKYLKGKPISSSIVYYTLETTYILSYINSSSSIGLFKYNWNDTNSIYELDQNYARKFLSSNTISFID